MPTTSVARGTKVPFVVCAPKISMGRAITARWANVKRAAVVLHPPSVGPSLQSLCSVWPRLQCADQSGCSGCCTRGCEASTSWTLLARDMLIHEQLKTGAPVSKTRSASYARWRCPL